MPTGIIYGCFGSATAEFYTCYRDCMAHKDRNIYYLALQKRFADSCFDLSVLASYFLFQTDTQRCAAGSTLLLRNQVGPRYGPINQKNLETVGPLIHSESTDWTAKSFYDTVGQLHPWILHGEVCKAIWSLLSRFMGYLGFLTTTMRPHTMANPSQRTGSCLGSCVSISWGIGLKNCALTGLKWKLRNPLALSLAIPSPMAILLDQVPI